MIIVTQEKALVNLDNVVSISVQSQEFSQETTIIPFLNSDSEDEATSSKEITTKIEHYVVADKIILGTYNTKEDAIKVLTLIIGNAIALGANMIMMPMADGIDEAIIDIINSANRGSNDDNTTNV